MKTDFCLLDFLTPEFLYKALRPGLSWEMSADKQFWESEARKLKKALKIECAMMEQDLDGRTREE